jgi:hypothetical protein
MLDEQEWSGLATRLLARTRSGTLDWTSSDEGLRGSIGSEPLYFTRIGHRTEYRVYARDRDGVLPFVFSIFRLPEEAEMDFDSTYKLLDQFETTVFELGDSSTSDWVYDLYQAAKRSASGGPRLFAALIEEIDGTE